MEQAKRKRTMQRGSFTRALNNFSESCASNESLENITVAYQCLMEKYQELCDVTKLIIDTLYDTPATTEAELNKEVDDADEYKVKFLKAKFHFEQLSKKADQPAQATSPIEQGEIKKKYKLPRIEVFKFSGEIRDWLPFWSRFKKVHEDPNIDNEEKLHYLTLSMVPGSRADALVNSYPPIGENYAQVITSLKSRFGREDLQIEVYVRELLQLVLQKAVTPTKEVNLASLYDKIETYLRSLESLGVTSDKYAAMLFPLVESALTEELLRAWRRNNTSLRAVARDVSDASAQAQDRLASLISFLEAEVQDDVRISMAVKGFEIKGANNDKEKYRRHYARPDSKDIASATSLLTVKDTENLCIFCGQRDHDSANCLKAKRISYSERQETVKRKNACFKCLKIGHTAKTCRVRVKCAKCARRHVTLMCYDKVRSSDTTDNALQNTSTENVVKECNIASLSSDPLVYLKTLRVKLVSDCGDMIVRLMIDDGSQKSYITKDAAAKMKYKEVAVQKINHSLFGGMKSGVTTHKKYLIRLANIDNSYACNFVAFDESVLCEEVPLIKKGPWCAELDKLNVYLSDLNSEEQSITILIGADVAGQLLTGRHYKLRCGLVAVETHLGWTVMGKVPGTEQREDPVVTAVSMYVQDNNVSSLWSLEALGINDPLESKRKQELHEQMKENFLQSVTINKEGRYEIELPWLENHPTLGDNKTISMRRLESTIKKLKAEGYYEDYNAVFQEWLAEGIIEYVPKEEADFWGHYLPHRHVVKHNSTTKIRPVFDASSKDRHSPSLNECLHTGPNLMELVSAILLRFRIGNIGVISDVKKAFLQISVKAQDRDFLRFLWFDEQGNIIIFRHCRVVFGVTCSPFILGAIINMHLSKLLESNSEISRANISKLAGSFYVDNCVTSVNDKIALETFITDAKAAMQLAGFDLRGWEYSGDSSLERQTPVLGIMWDKESDNLFINTRNLNNIEFDKITKRTILSVAHKVFDPLGFLCPVMLAPRVLLQETWSKKFAWDDEVDLDIKKRFIKWGEELKEVNSIQIPRCILGLVDEGDNISLHVFCDASKLAYAVVIFIRIERNSEVEVKFVQAKNRVAPVKNEVADARRSIPRLELLAASIGARLGSSVVDALDFKKYNIYYWTDSSTVLAWIKRECNWATFVWNRVKEIRELTDSKQWRHVPGHLNPADLPSRGCTMNQLVSSKWWEGPDWLHLPMERWPEQRFTFDEAAVNIEVKRSAVKTGSISLNSIVLSRSSNEKIEPRILERYSSFAKIKRVTAWMKRFLFNCKSNIGLRMKGELTKEELLSVENLLYRLIQQEFFIDENDDRIKHFRPFKDENGIIRLNSKIILRDDSFNFRCPLILPNEHAVVKLIIKEKHEELNHAGVEITLNSLRENYWILGGRKSIKSVIKECVICRRYNAQPVQEAPPPLPMNRVRDAAVFEIIGVDFTGPVYLKGMRKAWICIFTCAIYRAVHFELVNSLSTASFLMALRRHIARRGRPSVIYSDNGTNFTGLNNLIKGIDFTRLSKLNNLEKIKWIFNPPTAAWWGGFWERLIGVLKRLLRRTLKRACLNYEEMLTVLLDCEAIINARPITFVSENEHELAPLTPAMFLQDIKEIGVTDLDKIENCKLNKRFAYRQQIKRDLRQRFRVEYLGALVHHDKKFKNNYKIKVGDIVLIGNDNLKRLDWPLARVKDLIVGIDGNVRVVRLKTANGELIRPIQRVYPLEVSDPDTPIDESKNCARDCKPNMSKMNEIQTSERNVTDDGENVRITRSGRVVKQPERLMYKQ